MRSRMQGNPEFMRRAIALATENVSSGRGGPFGAVIVREGKVIATGVNQVTVSNDPTAHAEVVAIRKACGPIALCYCSQRLGKPVAFEEVMRRERTRHVVVIDDLDRVAPERAAEIGRLVSAVTDLPYVVHLLVLERTTLAESDLERVVQVPFDLPLPEGLPQMLFDDLRSLMAANPHSSAVTDEHWDQIFSPGIAMVRMCTALAD